jgi:hypothetical protein
MPAHRTSGTIPAAKGETSSRPKVMNHSCTPLRSARLLAWSIVIATLFAGDQALAFNPVISKLSGRPPVDYADDNFGDSVAISEAWIVVGAPSDDERGEGAGAVFVYSAVTGQFVRKLRAPDAVPFDRFGVDVAVWGSQALVGASAKNGGAGKAYLFNLSDGVLLREFVSGFVDGAFGKSVALNGRFAAIGAPSHGGGGTAYVFELGTIGAPKQFFGYSEDGPESFGGNIALSGNLVIVADPDYGSNATFRGVVYVIDVITEIPMWEILGTGSSARYGVSLAASGGKLLVGTGLSPGAAHLYDLSTGEFVRALSYPGNGSFFWGNQVAMEGNLALVGVEGDDSVAANAGAAYVFDVSTGALLDQITAPDGRPSAIFGRQVALSANGALFAAGNLSLDAPGAVYFMRPVSGPLPLASVAKIGDFAPGAPDTRFRTFGAAHLNSSGRVMFNAGLAGLASNGSTDTGVWSTLEYPRSLELSMKSRQDLTTFGTFNGQSYVGVRTATVQSPVLNKAGIGLFQSTLAGSGITSFNNRAIFREIVGPTNAVSPVLRTGRSIGAGTTGPSWNGANLLSILSVAQCEIEDHMVVPCSLRTGVAGTTLANDSGILVLSHEGVLRNTLYREGASSPAGGTFGQFFGRPSAAEMTYFAYRAFNVPAPGLSPKQGVYWGLYTGGGGALGVQGDDPGEVGGAKYAAFTGESLVDNLTYWMATLSGPGVTTLNNQTLWLEEVGLILRTGTEIEPGLFVSRIENYWAMDLNYILIQVLLRGAGVTAANNRALYVRREEEGSEIFQRLMRTGELAEGSSGGRIATFQRVVAEPSGRYAVLASLSGTLSSTNQALFMGNTRAGEPFTLFDVLREPFMVLRKGRWYQAPTGQSTRILSMTLTNTADTDGVGNKGMGQVINASGQIVINIQFSNLAREIMTGAP